MSSQQQSAKNQQENKNKPAHKPQEVVDQIEDQASVEEISPALLGVGDSDPVQRQADLLNDRRLSRATRQKAASQIAQLSGNQHLQRVMGQVHGQRQGQAGPGLPVSRHFETDNRIQRNGDDLDAGVPLPAGVPETGTPDSELRRELEQIWNNEGKDPFFARLRRLTADQRNDDGLNQFVGASLSGDDQWLALNILMYGPEANWPMNLRVEREMKGWGDSGGAAAVATLLGGASEADRRLVLNDTRVMNILRRNLSADEILVVATSLANLTAIPAGRAREATAQLILSSEEVDRNTALRLANGDVTTYYMEDLAQPPNVNAVVTAAGLDPAVFTVYLEPPENTANMFVSLNSQGFKRGGTSKIFGLRSLSIARWQTLLVHETSHARNPDTSDSSATTVVDRYKSEFRAYWVAEFRTVTDLDDRARQVKQHVLNSYTRIKAFYDSNDTVKTAIDAHTRPDGNVTNV